MHGLSETWLRDLVLVGDMPEGMKHAYFASNDISCVGPNAALHIEEAPGAVRSQRPTAAQDGTLDLRFRQQFSYFMRGLVLCREKPPIFILPDARTHEVQEGPKRLPAEA